MNKLLEDACKLKRKHTALEANNFIANEPLKAKTTAYDELMDQHKRLKKEKVQAKSKLEEYKDQREMQLRSDPGRSRFEPIEAVSVFCTSTDSSWREQYQRYLRDDQGTITVRRNALHVTTLVLNDVLGNPRCTGYTTSANQGRAASGGDYSDRFRGGHGYGRVGRVGHGHGQADDQNGKESSTLQVCRCSKHTERSPKSLTARFLFH